MINLLPLEEKQKLILKKKEKLATIWGIIVLVFLICLTLILLSIKFYILAETDFQKNILKQDQQRNQMPDFANLNNIIQKYNGTLTQLDSFYKKEIYFSQAVDIIKNIPTPNGLYLINFSLTRDNNGMVQVSATGVSDTRDDLLIFQKNVEQDQKIKNSYFPPENWVAPKNINFSVTFEIDQNEKQQ